MATLFIDTSALVKLYVREDGTDAMLRLASREEGHAMVLLALAKVEFTAAVRRRARNGDLSEEEADGLESRLERHIKSRFIIQPVTDLLIEKATLAARLHPLRAYDALQMAGCLVTKEVMEDANSRTILVCADLQLRNAARAEGLRVLDPSGSPSSEVE